MVDHSLYILYTLLDRNGNIFWCRFKLLLLILVGFFFFTFISIIKYSKI